MRSRVIVVDDFYPRPEVIRDRALRSEYADITASRYPGYQTKVNVESDAITRTFEALVDAEVQVDRSRFTWGGFRFITAESGRGSRVHADINIDWAGMVYLTEDADPGAGTGFFRHKETGVERPPTDREARALGYADAHEFQQRVVARDDSDFTRWELTTSIAPVYNRLILFRGCEFYHAPLGGQGESFAGARLTHNFFFNVRARVGRVAHALADR